MHGVSTVTTIVNRLQRMQQSSSGDTTPDGKQAFWIIGDSVARGSAVDGSITVPAANTVYQCINTTGVVEAMGSNDMNDAFITPVSGVRTQWPQFGIAYNTNDPRYKAVLLNSGLPNSTFLADPSASDSWVGGTVYGQQKTKANALLATLGVTRFKAIFIMLGVNDFHYSGSTANVQAAILTFFATLQADFPNTDIIVAQVGRDNSSALAAKLTAIRKTLKQVCADNTNVHMGPSEISLANNGFLPDNLHPNAAGNNYIGSMFARWMQAKADGYVKWARSLICNHYDEPSTTWKGKLNTFITTIGDIAYLAFDCWYRFKVSDAKNMFIDYAFYNQPTNVGSILTLNDSLALNGSAQYFKTGVIPSITNVNATQSDAFQCVKIKTNNTLAGTQGYVAAGQNAGTIITDLFQGPGSTIVGRFNNSAAFAQYVTDTKFQNNSRYGIGVNGTVQRLYKSGLAVGAAGSGATSGLTANEIFLGGNNNNGSFANKLDCSIEDYVNGKSSLVDQLVLHNALEALNT